MKEYTKKSMMRLAMLWTLRLSIALGIFIPIGIVLQIVFKQEVDMLGWSAFLGAIGVFITPVIIGKAQQKKYENGR